MKANEAPEKLYIISDEDGVMLSLDNVTDLRGDRYDFVDEAVFPVKEGTFEYTCTDAFIEKACEWFRRIDYDDSLPPFETTEEFIEGFKKAMAI